MMPFLFRYPVHLVSPIYTCAYTSILDIPTLPSYRWTIILQREVHAGVSI